MDVNLYVIKEYENETAFRLEQNKPNSNPIPPAKSKKTIVYFWYISNQQFTAAVFFNFSKFTTFN